MANEKRMIDATKVLERADEVTFMGFRAEERKKHFMDLVSSILMQCTTVDAVQVVRCKHCVYFGIYECTGNGYCRHYKGLVDPKPYNFCSYGERKDNEFCKED